jgi:hypothetical protein
MYQGVGRNSFAEKLTSHTMYHLVPERVNCFRSCPSEPYLHTSECSSDETSPPASFSLSVIIPLGDQITFVVRAVVQMLCATR